MCPNIVYAMFVTGTPIPDRPMEFPVSMVWVAVLTVIVLLALLSTMSWELASKRAHVRRHGIVRLAPPGARWRRHAPASDAGTHRPRAA